MAIVSDFNVPVVEEFRASGGKLSGPFAGRPMLLLHTTGARSGKTYVNPMMYLADQRRYVVFASYAGSDRNPAWLHNLRANPRATVEVGTETLAVTAVELTGEERDKIYAHQAELYPVFAQYQAKTSRVIPVVALVPAGDS